ncbi:peptidoglycan-binding protein, partial [Streptomyces sp. RSD-27]
RLDLRPVSTLARPAAAPSAAPAVEKAAAPLIYSVVGGDTLTKIATEHSVDGGWQALYDANRGVIGNDPSVIRPGLKLTLGGAAKAAAARAAALSPPSPVLD